MYRDRIARVQKKLIQEGLDALLVSNFYNILYLTGFKTSSQEEQEANLLITKKESFLFTDRRYNPEFQSVLFYSHEKRLTEYLDEITNKNKIKKIGIEASSLTVFEYQTLSKKLPKVSFISKPQTVESLRQVKDKDEIAKIKEACRLTDKCLVAITKNIKVGQTEKEIAFRIERWIKEKGHSPSFSPIVAADKNSATPHYDPSDSNSKIRENSLVLIDMGIKYKDYCSDITRMFTKGTCTSEVKKAYQKLLDVQQKTINKANRATKTKEIDLYCRKLIEKSGLEHFVHSTGHGVGLQVHEEPSISFRSPDTIQPGQVFTIEPGVYYENNFGLRIEDVVLITKNGIEVLTKFPKTLQRI